MQRKSINECLDALEKQRRALRMTLPALAKRAGLSRATVCRILKEKQASSSLQNVLAIVEVLGGELILRLQAPRTVVEHEVQAKARKIVRMVQGTMALEAPGITDPKDLEQLVEVAEIKAKPRKLLWISQRRNSNRSQAKRQSPISPS